MMESNYLIERGIHKLTSAVQMYTRTCPGLSAYYMSQAEKTRTILDKPRTPAHVACQYCGSVFKADNHTSHIEHNMKAATHRARRLLTTQQVHTTMATFQAKFLKAYLNHKNKLVILCLTCFKKSIVYGQAKVQRFKNFDKSHAASTTSKAVGKKWKRKEKLTSVQGNDSGLDLSFASFTSASSYKSTNNQSALSLSSVDSLAISDSMPKYTSTPIPEAGRKKKNEMLKTRVIGSPASRLHVCNDSGPYIAYSPDILPIQSTTTQYTTHTLNTPAQRKNKLSPKLPMNSKLENQLANILSFDCSAENTSHQSSVSVNTSAERNISAKQKPSKRDKKSILQHMLVKEKKQTLQHSSTLASFLSGLN